MAKDSTPQAVREPVLQAKEPLQALRATSSPIDNAAIFDLYPGEILAVIGDNGAGKIQP